MGAPATVALTATHDTNTATATATVTMEAVGDCGTDKNGMVPVGTYVCVIDYNEPGLGHEAKMIYVNY